MTRITIPALLLLSGCASVTCEDAERISPVLEVGVGEELWTPVSEGDEIYMVEGPQGGYHVFVGVRTEGVVPGVRAARGPVPPEIRYELVDDAGRSVGEGERSWPLRGDEEEALAVGDLLVVDIWELRSPGTYLLKADLVDACGTRLGDERPVLLLF